MVSNYLLTDIGKYFMLMGLVITICFSITPLLIESVSERV